MPEAFDTARYHDNQMEAFRMRMQYGEQQIIEFGGKPFGDYHASRVLPGYDPDIKARILQDLTAELGASAVTITMSLHAQDILLSPDGRRINRRIRGDSGLRYDDEVIRLIDQARQKFQLPVHDVVLSSLPGNLSLQNEDYIAEYKVRLGGEGIEVSTIRRIEGYPFLAMGSAGTTLVSNERPSRTDHMIVVSPGGGSGKFGVAVTDIAHKLAAGGNPNFVKFETFPVFGLPLEHPLNLAFLAATADLPNELTQTADGKTNYDKDVQNLGIIRALIAEYPELVSPLRAFAEPTDMGVNVIESGIIDEAQVYSACYKEIARRIKRYQAERANGDELGQTITRTQGYLGRIGVVGEFE